MTRRRPRSLWRLAAVGTATAVLLSLAGSVVAAPAPTVAGSDPAAVALLQRAAVASRSVAYSGVQMVTQWAASGPTTLMVNVLNVPGVGVLARLAETAGSPSRGSVLDPDDRAGALSVGTDEVALLRDHYRLVLEPPATVDGRVADVVGVLRPNGVVAARFWVDRASGLVLRRDLLDGRGRLSRVTTFIDISVLRRPPQLPLGAVAAVRPATGRPLGAAAVAGLGRQGFDAPVELPQGYRLVDARMFGGPGARTLHLTYCDGLSTMSVFEQRGRLDTSRMSGWRAASVGGHRVWLAPGMPQRLAWSGGGVAFTVVADAPEDVLASAVSAWPHGGAHPGLLVRLRHGLARIGSWLNPFS